MAIARLDRLSRNEEIQAKLGAFDLVVCDETKDVGLVLQRRGAPTPSATSSAGSCEAEPGLVAELERIGYLGTVIDQSEAAHIETRPGPAWGEHAKG